MISRIGGVLESVEGSVAVVACGAISYEVLVPAADLPRLEGSVGKAVEFHTVHILESVSQGASYRPRLLGFASRSDREFFELVTSVRGLGNRKALRALAIPFHRIAEAIAGEDIGLLSSLPEIGRKTAQTICGELRDKVDPYLRASLPARSADDPVRQLAFDAVEVLVQLGESRLAARDLVDRAISSDAGVDSVQAAVTAALRLRGQGAGRIGAT